MTLTELRRHHATLYQFIFNERKMRFLVFPPGHEKRDAKLAECDKALIALEKLKDQAKLASETEMPQAALLDTQPATKAY